MDILQTPWLLAAVGAIVFVAAIVQFRLGFGFGLMAAPLLAVLDPVLVPAPTLMIGMGSSAMGAWRERGSIVWGEVWTGLAGRLAGVVLAMLLLASVGSPETFGLVFGLMVGLAVILSALGLRLPFTRTSLVGMAAVSGTMATVTSVGAPPMAIIYQHRPPGQARPTLAAFFAAGCVASLVGLGLAGRIGADDFLLAALMVPPMLLGFAVARRLELKAGTVAGYRRALLAVAGFAAVVLVVRGRA